MPVPKLLLGGRPLIPALGFGVGTAWFQSAGGGRETELIESVHAALDAGFRHIDEAEMYCNEAATGKAITSWLSRTGTPRQSLFVTSKVMSVDEGVGVICRRSLQAMGLSYFDLYLVHAPFQRSGTPFATPLSEVWRQMEELVDAGLTRAIGVSNWRVCECAPAVTRTVPPRPARPSAPHTSIGPSTVGHAAQLGSTLT